MEGGSPIGNETPIEENDKNNNNSDAYTKINDTPLEKSKKEEELETAINGEKNSEIDALFIEITKNGETNLGEEETIDEEEEEGSDSYHMFLEDSDNEQNNDLNDESITEVALTEEEVEELIQEFLDVESKAAEAQESLEKEALSEVEKEVRAELSESLEGEELDLGVRKEMDAFIAQWEITLDELETRSSVLLEQLDGAGIELPSLYKYIEGQIPDKCRTETWRKRVHWVGTQASEEIDESVKDAEEFLKSCRPVRKKHGRLLEEGASGFLAGKLPINNNGNPSENNETGWNSFNQFIQSKKGSETGFGSTNWASVYLASTPQQAASLGLNFPGVDEVEEIADIEGDDAEFKGLNELELSEEQQRKYRKVREEDDENRTRRMQHHLKQERTRKKRLQPTFISDLSNGHFDASENENGESSSKLINSPKRRLEGSESESEAKLSNKKLKKTEVETDSDDEIQILDSNSASQVKRKSIEVIDLDDISTPIDSIKNQGKSVIKCTLCTEILKNSSEVHRHPVLEVVVCGSCKFALLEKIRLEGPDGTGYCKWCGKSEDLLNCGTCNMQFCEACINRNLGEKCLSDAKSTGTAWKCCCCEPSLLEDLISQCEKALRNPEISSSESGSDHSEPENEKAVTNGKRRRKKRIRRIIDDAELAEETKIRIAEEKARQEHLKSMQESASKLSSKIFEPCSTSVSPVVFEAVKEGYIINIAREIDEIAVRIPNSISIKLKPHQVAGIRFMWENVIQSVKKAKSGDKGLGCILAHTMGLGKTFQVIAFLYTVMRSVDLGIRSVLIVTPVNVLHNWKNEFRKWQPTEQKPLRVYLLEDVTRVKRLYLLSKWRAKGGILLMGYVSFRNLSQGKGVKDRNIAVEIGNILHNAADILVCDEAHLIKNRMAETTQALKQIRTQRRIALTGSPLQNNLMEYYCMVDFVREGYLGSSHEFRNRFQNPIENGQHANTTADDVKVMNQRSHILYEQLKGFVQRMDMNVVKKDLPPKTVFVITVKLSPLQRRLYKRFLDVHGFTSNTSSDKKVSCFFAGYTTLAQVWNHPGLLQMRKENKNSKKDVAGENFLDDDSSSDDNLENYLLAGEKQKMKNDLKKSEEMQPVEEKWWESLLEEKTYQEVDLSGKMVLLLDILSMSSELGDKSLIFSQSIPTIDLIEFYLSKMRRKGTEDKFWKQGKDWYRIDGTTPALERQNLVERFNDPSNKRVKCCLISTRAGSLGINLHAANRVVLVDGSWNPTYDLQAIYRAWRYGQKKPVYAYRLLAHGTMEEKIYKRQVTKEGLAARVVDRQQVYRTMSKEEILHLFDFGDEELLDQSTDLAASLNHDNTGDVGTSKEKHNSMPAQEAGCFDMIMNNLLSLHQPSWIANYHEHETLLQENEAERLTKEEQEMAWLNYQRSLEWEEVQRTTHVEEQNTDKKAIINSNNSNNVLALESTVHQVQQQVKVQQVKSSHSHQAKGASSSSNPKNRAVNQRKCSNLAHLLTLRSVGAKAGSSTTCADCGQEISWETLNRDGRSR